MSVIKIFIGLLTIFNYTQSNNWQNWAKNQKCSPYKIVSPATISEVQDLINQAHVEQKSIRFVGSGHSWSDLLCTSGYIVTTEKFDKILAVDKDKLQVRIEGGIKVKDLVRQLASYGLALSNQGFSTEQSIAGAIATATHGSGHTGTLSDFVVSVELVDAQGSLLVISDEIQQQWLPAARVHLGALGFIYAVTLQCEPLFVLTYHQELMDWEKVIKQYNYLYAHNDYFLIMGLANSDAALVYSWNKTTQPINANLFTILLEKILLSRPLAKLGMTVAPYLPHVIDTMIGWTFKFIQQKNSNYSYLALSPLINPLEVTYYLEAEQAIPLEKFPDAIEAVRALCKQYEKRDQLISVITCRFGPGYTLGYLNPNFGRDTAYISVSTLNNSKDHHDFYEDFSALLAHYNGRPHWGKINYLNKQTVYKLYGENARKFNRIRKALDPSGLFANSFIRRCFG